MSAASCYEGRQLHMQQARMLHADQKQMDAAYKLASAFARWLWPPSKGSVEGSIRFIGARGGASLADPSFDDDQLQTERNDRIELMEIAGHPPEALATMLLGLRL